MAKRLEYETQNNDTFRRKIGGKLFDIGLGDDFWI